MQNAWKGMKDTWKFDNKLWGGEIKWTRNNQGEWNSVRIDKNDSQSHEKNKKNYWVESEYYKEKT